MSLAAEAGECIAIIGPSGSGKTTLLSSSLATALKPSQGTAAAPRGESLETLQIIA
ncbi:ATP-binding cassette domain-containing protein [Polynucleobacter necessarius]|uniref:ATP-binding cassette domain-containing protein n=1 Tax=Polynucleobacter necessarius TaxID=576610 RepID=UPI0013B054C4